MHEHGWGISTNKAKSLAKGHRPLHYPDEAKDSLQKHAKLSNDRIRSRCQFNIHQGLKLVSRLSQGPNLVVTGPAKVIIIGGLQRV